MFREILPVSKGSTWERMPQENRAEKYSFRAAKNQGKEEVLQYGQTIVPYEGSFSEKDEYVESD
jgi:hypothetical protein